MLTGKPYRQSCAKFHVILYGKAYGFHWRHEKGPSTNCRSEDELHSEA